LIGMDLKHHHSDEEKYYRLQALQFKEWEKLCRCCGSCCGIPEDDPCEHLVETSKGKYRCAIYKARFGIHKTKNGRIFKCVPIREILHMSWAGDQNCSYKHNKTSCEF